MQKNRPLLILVLLALLLRAVCVALFAGEIDPEGSEYARIAQNLIAGKGYVGISTPGTQLFFPPLFAFLIAAGTWFLGDAELAGRSLSVLFGTLLVVPVYLIARRMFDAGAGLWAAALVAFHPYLVMFSTTVYCESTFLTLLLAAVYSAMRAASNPTRRALAATGCLYGASYLVRPESLLFMLVASLCVLLARVLIDHAARWHIARQIWIIPFAFLVITGPYIVWLSMEVGQVRIEGKSPLNLATEWRQQQGQSSEEASMRIDKDLIAQGVWNQPNIDMIRTFRLSPGELAVLALKKTKAVLRNTAASIAGSLEFGAPALFALAVLGFFSRTWRPRLALEQLHLLILLSLTVFGTYFIYYSTLRFYLLFLVCFCIWAAASRMALQVWALRSAALFGVTPRVQRAVAMSVWSLAIAAVIVPATAGAMSSFLFMRDTRPIKAAAVSMAGSREPIHVADTTPLFAFHARAEFTWLPYSDEATALRYLQMKRVTHVVLRSGSWVIDSRPYHKKWFTDGIPNARLVTQVSAGTGEQALIYELGRAPGD
jgi:4-amino-4-deoxy-L-arabinose transferase-like glycosyltransferase